MPLDLENLENLEMTLNFFWTLKKPWKPWTFNMDLELWKKGPFRPWKPWILLHFYPILTPFWHYFYIIFTSFWSHFETLKWPWFFFENLEKWEKFEKWPWTLLGATLKKPKKGPWKPWNDLDFFWQIVVATLVMDSRKNCSKDFS